MSKYLIYNSCGFFYPHICVQIDEAERLFNAGNEVVFAYCDGVMDCCYSNPESNPLLCLYCRLQSKMAVAQLSKGIDVKALKKRGSPIYLPEISSISELKDLQYKGVKVGYSVLSTYVSATRNPYPNFELASYRKILNYYVLQCINLVNAVDELVKDSTPQIIGIYNGRLFEMKPFIDLAKRYNIPFYTVENVGGKRCGKPYRTIQFDNSTPHNIKSISQRINLAWMAQDSFSIEEKEVIGKSFFQKRREGIPTNDRVYVDSQESNLLPGSFNKKKINIAIFNSSEDEFVGIGDEFEKYALFPSQLIGIEQMLEHFKNNENIHFYLRVHPNLKKVDFSYHTDLYLLEKKYSNITVIHANSPISTYTLLDKVDKVVSFGSTMGIEATFWGKPSILLAGATYYYCNSCYIPRTSFELFEMIENPMLQSIDSMEAIKYGYYCLNAESISRTFSFFDINNRTLKFLWKKWEYPSFVKLCGSNLLSGYFSAVFYFIATRFGRRCMKLPDRVV